MAFQPEVIYNAALLTIEIKYYDFVCPEITLQKSMLCYVEVLT